MLKIKSIYNFGNISKISFKKNEDNQNDFMKLFSSLDFQHFVNEFLDIGNFNEDFFFFFFEDKNLSFILSNEYKQNEFSLVICYKNIEDRKKVMDLIAEI